MTEKETPTLSLPTLEEQVFVLSKPIVFGNQKITELKIREVTAGDLMDTNHIENAETRALTLLAKMNDLTPDYFRTLGGREYGALLGEFIPYLPDTLGLGLSIALGLPASFISSQARLPA